MRVEGIGVVANLHASNELARPEIPTEEVRRARAFVESVAHPDEPIVLAGDFNVSSPSVDGFSAAAPGIDQVLVRGAPCTPPVVWERPRRTVGGVVLSDHAPVDVLVG